MSDDLNIQYMHSLDRGLSYAESCFETFRVIDGAIFSWNYHWQRLQSGLQSFGFSLDEKHQTTIFQACIHAAEKIGQDCLVRLTVTSGATSWGLQQTAVPKVYIQSMAYQKSHAEIHLLSHEYSFPLIEKPAKYTADYAFSLRALQLWQVKSHTSVLVCQNESIISGMTANIALFNGKQWNTPKGKGVLKGTIRQFLIHQGLLHPNTCATKNMKHIHAAVLLNAGSFIQPIHSIDGIVLDACHPAITMLSEKIVAEQGVHL